VKTKEGFLFCGWPVTVEHRGVGTLSPVWTVPPIVVYEVSQSLPSCTPTLHQSIRPFPARLCVSIPSLLDLYGGEMLQSFFFRPVRAGL